MPVSVFHLAMFSCLSYRLCLFEHYGGNPGSWNVWNIHSDVVSFTTKPKFYDLKSEMRFIFSVQVLTPITCETKAWPAMINGFVNIMQGNIPFRQKSMKEKYICSENYSSIHLSDVPFQVICLLHGRNFITKAGGVLLARENLSHCLQAH